MQTQRKSQAIRNRSLSEFGIFSSKIMNVLLPKIPTRLKDIIDEPAALKPGACFDRIILRWFDALNKAAQKMKFDESALDRLALVNAALDEIMMLDTEIRGCDLSAAVLSGSSLNRVRFTNCRMAGVDLSRAQLENVTFADCRLDMANFRFSKLDSVAFEGCTLIEADFQVGELFNVALSNCTIERAIFDQCKLRQVDARGSELREIHGWRYLRGLTIDHAQLVSIAPELADDLGLKIQ
jgi:uncharacterized protein YjbI with pentapeptide repeats